MLPISKSIEQGFGAGGLYDILKQLQNQMLLTPTKVYYVSKGGNNVDGLSWETAFTTIEAAIIAQTAMRAALPTAQNRVASYIIVAPGTYDENITTLPYSCDIIGLGHAGTSNYPARIYPAEGSPIKGDATGLGLYNLRFQLKTTAVDCLDFGTLHAAVIDNCDIITDTGEGINALSTDDCQNTIIRNCRVYSQDLSLFTNGFYFNGGASQYLSGCKIENNYISGLDATGTGIYVDGDCVNDGTIIKDNIIELTGAGRGIDIGRTGSGYKTCVVIDNFVYHVSGTAYSMGDKAANNIDKDGSSAPVWNPTFS